MAKKSASPSPDEGTADPTSARADSSAEPTPKVTRASAAWVAIGVALLLLIFLIVFILQNPSQVEIQFLGMVGNVPLGVALLIAAVAGGVVVAIAGAARVTQLRLNARRVKRSHPGP